MTKQFFGTDGIRGKVGKGPITPEFILKLGWAVGSVLREDIHKEYNVIIGKDTRISGYLFESALEAGLSAAGVNIRLLGPMPTPAIAYLTRTFRADIGIVISASHNPYFDNGIKFFSTEGNKLPDKFEIAIEKKLAEHLHMVDSAELGKASRIDDATGRYIEFCKSTFPNSASLRGLKIVLDCANGATYHVAPYVFRELGAEVLEINTSPDGFNINENCGSMHPELLRKLVLAEEAHLGIALDGDGDRVLMVDHEGEIVDGDSLLYVIAMHAAQKNYLGGGIVGTEMSNLALEIALQEKNIPFERTNVGDRYVMEKLRANGWLYGGEPSGHILCLDKTTTGDGIVSALQILRVMVEEQSSLRALHLPLKKLPQRMINLRKENAKKFLQQEKTQAIITQQQQLLANDGRILVRASGTEPLIRIMVEGHDANNIETVAKHLAHQLEKME